MKRDLELAKEYYKLATKSSLIFYVLLTFVTYIYWGELSSPMLLFWVALNYFNATLFLLVAQWFKRNGTQENSSRWLRIYTYLVLIHDIPWGFIGPMSFTIDNEVYRMLTLFMLGGITAGRIITRAAIFKNYVISVFAILLPISISLAMQNTTVSDSMLGMIMIYIVFLLSVAKVYSETINRNMQLWLDKEVLVEELRESHTEIKEANQYLTREIEYRKVIEGELVEAKEQAELANRAKSQFLATISHELRTPLNGIMGFTEILQSEPLKASYKHPVDQIGKAGKNLLNIVNDILDITAIEAGHIRFHEEPFSLRSEMSDLVSMLKPMASQKGLSVELLIDDEVENNLIGDISRIRQIIGNLLSNALKYTETGGVSLHITLKNNEIDRTGLRFDIKDTGIGIAADALATIFDNFTRLEGFETRRTEGTGLGLAIVKNLVDKLGGRLDVQSEIGIGSCFSCELSFVVGRKLKAVTNQSFKPCLLAEQWREVKVLIVDDNKINRMLFSAFLTKMGAPFAEASNGAEALKRLHQERYDIVLLDIQMPDISGIEVAAKVRTEFASPPLLIAITAHAFPEQRKTIIDAGFSDFLIKPVTMDVLSFTLTQAYHASLSVEKIDESVIKC